MSNLPSRQPQFSMSSLLPALFLLLIVVLLVPNANAGGGSRGGDSKTSGSVTTSKTARVNINSTALDCGIRQLALEYAQDISRFPAGQQQQVLGHVFDALQLSGLCHKDKTEALDELSNLRAASDTMMITSQQRRRQRYARTSQNMSLKPNADFCSPKHSSTLCVFVASSPESSHLNATTKTLEGSIHRPFLSLRQAVQYLQGYVRNAESTSNRQVFYIVLRQGVHYLEGMPLDLSNWQAERTVTIQGYPGETVWISGGLRLLQSNDAIRFRPIKKGHGPSAGFATAQNNGLWVANLTTVLEGRTLPKIVSLFTSTRRYTRARYPNGDPELVQWGYSSPMRRAHSLSSENVHEWVRPPPGTPPTFSFYDFSQASHSPDESVPIKNNSAQPGYNWYASGRGGVCSDVWGDEADSYWCSNASQGGWSEVDRECAISGRMQLPVGMFYNRTASPLAPLHNSSLQGAFIHAWHSQSWSMHMFEVTKHTEHEGIMSFAKGGGRQGGRNWCRCDQCTYAGGWCGQHQTHPYDDDRLIGGDWMIENALHFLDQPGEYFFDRETNHLYVRPNSTEDLHDFTLGLMTELVNLRGARNVVIENVGFRDMAATYMEENWSAPSGGDWSLHRGGAIHLENASNVTIRGCHFFRLDGNAVFLSRRTRFVKIEDSIFEWLGENAIATWGDTDDYDGTAENFPMFTLIQNNVFREIGIYQKQSSAVGQCKASLTIIRNNLMFNMARAAINFNDMLGGGDVVTNNLIFNTCRESGDHGPINSWDRQAFLTTLQDGHTKSFDPLQRDIHHNFIFANYGASEGVDNDDGSSWFHIHHNLFYMSYGFKMDYGGHDSIFEDNLVLAFPAGRSQCFGMGSFFEGHGDTLQRNRCLLGLGQTLNDGCSDIPCLHSDWDEKETDEDEELVGTLWGGCNPSHATLTANEYYTPNGKAFIRCGSDSYTLDKIQEFGLEVNSTQNRLPKVDLILDWAKALLNDSVDHHTDATQVWQSVRLMTNCNI